ncbi:MAG: hypothetical protein WC593_15035 [Methanoregula sp.]
MTDPPIKQPFYEKFKDEAILSRPWHMWFCVVSDQVVGSAPPPVRQDVLENKVISKPWVVWLQALGTLQGISEAPFQEPLLEGDYVSEPWSKWFALVSA